MPKNTTRAKHIQTAALTMGAIGTIGALSALMLTGTATAQTDAYNTGPTLRIENFIGTVDVVESKNGKISVTDADGAPVSKSGGDVTIDAEQTVNNSRCKTNKHSVKIAIGNWKLNKRGGGYKDIDTYPHIKISAPTNTHLIIEKSVIFGDVADIGSGDVHVRSCGDISIGNVAGDMKLGISGSGDVSLGDVGGNFDVRVSGSGDLEAENVANIELDVSGSGDVSMGNVAQSAIIQASGSSDIELARVEGNLEYEGSGSSDVEADYVGGDLSIRSSGAGDITVDEGNVDKLYIRASGASDVSYDGQSNSAEAYASGAADININAPSGKLSVRESGAGDVNVDG